MNALDGIVLVMLVLAGYHGWKQAPLKHIIAVGGLVASILLAVLMYRQLAFLTEQSGMRVVVLVLLAVAVMFLAYDVCLSLGDVLLRNISRKTKLHTLSIKAQTTSAAIGMVGLVIVVWLTAGVLSGSQVPFVQRQITHSSIVSLLNTIAQPPASVRQVAHLLGPFSSPQVFVGQEPDFDNGTSITAEFSNLDSATQKAQESVVKINAWGCGSTTVGSGFVSYDSLIVTNAHVVAGADRISIEDTHGAFSASTVFFDPRQDIAVLRAATALEDKPLSLRSQLADPGTVGSAIGYPGGRSLMTSDGIILSTLNARGYDIYGQTITTRRIYAFRGRIVPGNSGGPLVDTSGVVLGLIFGDSSTQANTGFALPSTSVLVAMQTAMKQTGTVSTGNCTSQ